MTGETKSEIIVDDISADGETGHITMVVLTRSTRAGTDGGSSTWDGPKKQYGVDASVFENKFGGSVDNLLIWVAQEHKRFTGVHEDMHRQLHSLKGKTIG